MGYLLGKLACSLDNEALVIEGAMHLHTYVFDCRNQNDSSNQDVNPHSSSEESIDRQVFELDLEDNALTSVFMDQDSGRGLGRPKTNDRDCRLEFFF